MFGKILPSLTCVIPFMLFRARIVAPFEGADLSAKSRTQRRGLQMVFFEARGDEIIPGHKRPLNTLRWEGRILGGNLGVLPSIIGIPG